jgi:hypothetical protein
MLILEQIGGDSIAVRDRGQRRALSFRDFPRRHEAAFRLVLSRTMDT